MRNVSRLIILLILASALFGGFSAQAAEQVSGKTFYTTANIWYESKGIQIDSTNYHMGAFLPIGTNVKIIEVYDGMTTHENPLGAPVFERFIRFEDEAGHTYKLIFLSKHAREGMTVWDFFRQYFSENNPMGDGGAFWSLTAEEQKSVLAGEITVGMSKTAVVMAYGYPPSHRTPSLQQDKWIYWVNWFKTRTVLFSDDKVIADPRKTQQVSSIDACIKACKENTKRTPEQCFDACNH
jgi:hypothetical protein